MFELVSCESLPSSDDPNEDTASGLDSSDSCLVRGSYRFSFCFSINE